MFKRLSLLAVAFALAVSPAFAGGNELMYTQVQSLTLAQRNAISATADFVPVYSASQGKIVRVPAASIAGSAAPMSVVAGATFDATYCGKELAVSTSGAAKAFILPAATGTGCRITVNLVTVNTSGTTITRAGTDKMFGGLVFASDNASNAELGFETGSGGANVITLNGTTTGGAAVGDYVTLQDMGTGVWLVRGTVTESGTEATPFS